MSRFTIFFVIIFALFLYCKNNPHQNKTNNTQSFTTVYTNYLRATLDDSVSEANKNALFDSTLAQSQISMEDFKNSLFYLRSHPEEFDKILTAIIDSLEQTDIPKKTITQ